MYDVKVSLDRLTLKGTMTPELEGYLNFSVFVDNRRTAAEPYRWNFNLLDGSFLQIPQLINGELRLDFNPTTAHSEIFQVIKRIKDPEPTRVDIAIDYYDIDLLNDGWNWMHKPVKTRRFFAPDGKLETLYIGAPSSDRQIRIYDKAKEQGIEGQWTRVEVQLRHKACKELIDPFRDLYAVTELNLSGLKPKEKAIVLYMYEKNAYTQFDFKTRKKYKDHILRNSKLLEPQPKEVWEREKASILAQILTYTIGDPMFIIA